MKRRHPELYTPVKIKFWSLRNRLGSNGGVAFDIDTEVVRLCCRILCDEGWKWQLVNYHRDVYFDWLLETDKEILDNYLSDLEYEIV